MGSGNVWETVHVLFASTDKSTGAISAHIGDVVSGEGTDDSATVMQHWGFLSLPAAADAGVAGAECIALKTSGPDIIIAGRDVRSAYIAGLIQPGETSVYASGSQACELFKNDGTVILYTTHDNTVDGRAVYLALGPTGRDFCFPYGRDQFDSTGVHIHHVSGATLDMGSLSAPAPLDTFSSYFTVTASMMRLKTSFISIGPDTGIPSPVARADSTCSILVATSAALGTVNAALVAVGAALAALQAGKTGVVDPSTLTAAAAAIGLATTSIGLASSAVTAGIVGTVPVPGPIGSQALVTM